MFFYELKNNFLYRFYILVTSARSGVSRFTKQCCKEILGIPFPTDEERYRID